MSVVVVRTWHTQARRGIQNLSRLVASHHQPQYLVHSPRHELSLTTRDSSLKSKSGTSAHLRHFASRIHDGDSTIYALSTAPGRAAIAIVRISGPACLAVYRSLCPGKNLPEARFATLRTLYQPGIPPSVDSTLDSNALVFYFPAPHTVTGEAVLELHVHGGPAVVKAVLSAIPQCDISFQSIRYAEPGEFTRRAFSNGRLDLTQVEALGDVLLATTEQQRRLAVRGTSSNLSEQYETWRKHLLYARGELEALIDFSEDQHFDETPHELYASVSKQVHTLREFLQAYSDNAVRGELLRNGISLSFLGAPNAGKSSLLNSIVGRDAAIVSHEAGTTRDVVEVGIDLGGYFCRLGDTAGLRTARHGAHLDIYAQELIGEIEKEGMRRAKERAATSDAVVLVLSFELVDNEPKLHLDPEVISTAAELIASKNNVLVVVNKSDLSRDLADLDGAVHAVFSALPGVQMDRIFLTSCKEPNAHFSNLVHSHKKPERGNIQKFLQGLVAYFADLTAAISPDHADATGDASIWQDSLGASERHRTLLVQCMKHLDAFLVQTRSSSPVVGELDEDGETDIVVAAEHLRNAAGCLAKITGRGEAGDVEQVLGVVFEKFCVGK